MPYLNYLLGWPKSLPAADFRRPAGSAVTGCDKVSTGCKFCYAERFAERFRGVKGHPYEHGFDLVLHADRLEQPLKWRRPRLVFVNSMSDLFHAAIPDVFRHQVFEVMERAEVHVFQVLTKRADLMAAYCNDYLKRIPHNVWLGVTVENCASLWRTAQLKTIPAALRFVSCEPLLGPVHLDLEHIGWVIVGGESGPGARPMNPEWAKALRNQCLAAGVPFFFKQWGGVHKKRNGRLLDGVTWDGFPRLPDQRQAQTA